MKKTSTKTTGAAKKVQATKKGTGKKGAAKAAAPVAAPAEEAPRTDAPETVVAPEAQPAKGPRTRDARLPEAGTPMARQWRGHVAVAIEQADGTFELLFDGEGLGVHKSLTRAAEVALAKEGITSGVNGFVWFKVGTPGSTPRARKGRTVEALAGEVARLQARFDKAAQHAAKAEADLEAATQALATARAAAETAAAPVA